MHVGISLPVRELKDDLGALKDFAQAAEGLGLTHLRVPEQIFRADSGPLHEPLTLLSWIAAHTSRIELVPSVVILPARQTVLFAKQAATLDQLCGGRLRIGVGVGGNKEEYRAAGVEFRSRGRRCDEQMALLRHLWSDKDVHLDGEFHHLAGGGIDPLPVKRHIPLWVGARSMPSDPVVRRIGTHADGWFVLATPEEYPVARARIDAAATAAGRDPATIGTEAGVAVVGPREAQWRDRVLNWTTTGLTHLCLRTLGGGLKPGEHVPRMEAAVRDLPSA